MDENKILYADNLVIGNDGRALTKKMSFRIGVGECILLCGANGIGKSTLLRTLAGVIPAVSGEIGMRGRRDGAADRMSDGQTDGSRWKGHRTSYALQTYGSDRTEERTTGDGRKGHRTGDDLPQTDGSAGIEERQKRRPVRVILVPARIPKVPGFSVTDFVATSCYRESDWLGRLPAKIRGRISETLETLGIGHLAGRDISSLSDGEFQKAAIATALLQQAEVILLDEPTAFLDVDSRESALCTLREVVLKKHVSIIFSSHDIHTAAKYCTRVFGMRGGDDRGDRVQAGLEIVNGNGLDRANDRPRSSRDIWDQSSLAELIDTGPGCTREQRDAVFSRCFRYWGEDSEN